MVAGLTSNVSYQYDNANRLTTVNGPSALNYTYDNNGNLLNDGQNIYVYDSANRLISVNGTTLYTYNGMGDRLSQTVNGNTTTYTLDLNVGLTQVLDDGTNAYTYGLGRISQKHASTTEYFLGDALSSVRQLTDGSGGIAFAQSYDPYGTILDTSPLTPDTFSTYGYTGEQQDSSGMVYLRARYYNPADGRFMSRDTWGGDMNRPSSFNRWIYVNGNPINSVDPSGHDGGIPPIAQNYLEKLRSKTEQCYNDGDTDCVWSSYFKLALFAPSFGFQHSSAHLFNYLQKGGDINYSSRSIVPGPAGTYKESSRWVFEADHARQELRKATKQMWVKIHKDAMIGLKSGDVKSDDFATGYPAGGTDIYYALGDFYVFIEAHYEIKDCDVTVKPIYHFKDEYDWHPGLPAGGAVAGLAGFKDEWAASLKPDNAQEFNITGDWNGPNKTYHFSNNWFSLPASNNKYLSWEYLDSASKYMDIFHFDD